MIGGGDFANDRIIPDCVRAAQKGEAIIVRNPRSKRPYQHVIEPLNAYLMIIEAQYHDRSKEGYYNVGPDDCDCVNTGDLVGMFCQCWGDGLSWESKTTEGPHEAGYLKLDCSRLKSTFGWAPEWGIKKAVEKNCRMDKSVSERR